jgi:hypothetical protein
LKPWKLCIRSNGVQARVWKEVQLSPCFSFQGQLMVLNSPVIGGVQSSAKHLEEHNRVAPGDRKCLPGVDKGGDEQLE